MYHYIYKTMSESGKYYIGRHSTSNLEDNYLGSGTWVRYIKDKTSLRKEILLFCDTFEQLLELEKTLISEHVSHDNCMNFNDQPIGFATGSLNPASRVSQREATSERIKGDNNPSKRKEVAEKISKALTGRPSPLKGTQMSDEAKRNISNARIGISYSKEGKEKLSKIRKIHYEEGRRGVPSFYGLEHTPETILKMSQSAKNREKRACVHCGKICAVNILARFHDDKCKLKYEDLVENA
jgi:hypothetical protein